LCYRLVHENLLFEVVLVKGSCINRNHPKGKKIGMLGFVEL
jgi:hypothetical protein